MRQGTTSRSVLALLALTLFGCATLTHDPKLAFERLKATHQGRIQKFVDRQNAANPDEPIVLQDSKEQIFGAAPARMLSWPEPPCPLGYFWREKVLLVGVVEHDGTIGAVRMFGGPLTTVALSWFRD